MSEESHAAKKRRMNGRSSQLESQPSFLADLEMLQETNQATKGTHKQCPLSPVPCLLSLDRAYVQTS